MLGEEWEGHLRAELELEDELEVEFFGLVGIDCEILVATGPELVAVALPLTPRSVALYTSWTSGA